MDKSHLITGDELVRIAGSPTTKIMDYGQLQGYHSVDELFKDSPKIALLYVFKQSGNNYTGHWIGLMRRGNTVEVYDSYNFQPDVPLKRVADGYANQLKGLLSRLLLNFKKQGGAVEYNEDRVQSRSPDVATCGRWVALRLKYYNMPLPKFQRAMDRIKDGGGNLDDFVTWWSNSQL